MKSLNFNDGYKEFMINEDPKRVIRINPADMEILARFDEAVKEIEAAQNDIQSDVELKTDGDPLSQLEQAGEVVRKLTELIKGQINYIFNADVADVIFGNQSPMSLVGGAPLYEQFFEAVIPEIAETLKEERKKSEERVSKYVGMVK